LFGLLLCFSVQNASAEDVNNIRFPERDWDGQILSILDSGPVYLDRTLEFDIPPPPVNDSEQTRNELDLLRRYALEERTTEQLEKIRIEASKGDFVETYLEHGPFNAALTSASYDLLRFADREVRYFIVRDKKRYARPRPSQLTDGLELVVPNPGHAAYPSGHATQSMIMSEILGMIDPAHADSYVDYAYAIARRREIAGVHYPSDSAAGQYLAGKVLVALMQVAEFRDLLDKAQSDYMQQRVPHR
jgi:acid phosphatase (class A)